MEKNNKIQKRSDNILKKLFNLIRSFFYNNNREKSITKLENAENIVETNLAENNFIGELKISKDRENLFVMKKKFDNKMIDVKDIPINEKNEMIGMYKKEILEKRNKLQNIQNRKEN